MLRNKGQVLSQQPQPQLSALPITECGVRLSYLAKLASSLKERDVDAYGLVQKLILPATKGLKKSHR